MLADPSHLAEIKGTINRVDSAGKQIGQNLRQEIARLERTLKIVQTYGTELPALAIRGHMTWLKAAGWNALQKAIQQPADTVEGAFDVQRHRVGGADGMGKDASAVLRVHQINLPAGKKNARKAAVILMTPALKARIKEQLRAKNRAANTIGNQDAVDDGSVNDAVIQHYVPNTPLPEKPPRLKEAFARLGRRAIIVRQRADSESIRVARADRGAQDAVYITIDAGNQGDAH